jgi:hypothetical protein
MSMEICVLSDVRLASIVEWQDSIKTENFPLRLPQGDPLIGSVGGNLLTQLRDKDTMIEYSVVDFSELKQVYKNVNFGRDWRYVIAFTWSSDFDEELAAWMAATAYARATRGIIFDEHEGKLLTPEESVQITREIEGRQPELKALLQNHLQGLSAKSPEAAEALREFIQRRLTKSGER